MKGPQLSALIWLANIVVLAGGAMAGYKVWEGIESDRGTAMMRTSEIKTKEKRIAWQNSVDASTTGEHKYFKDTLLSPRARPVPRKDPGPPPPPPPPPKEPTDDELRAELEAWLKKQFRVMRLYYGSEEFSKAVVFSEEAKMTVLFTHGLKFKEFGKASDDKIKKLAAHDLEIKGIEWDHVIVRGPSRNAKYKDRYYEIKLGPDPKAYEPPTRDKIGKQGKPADSKIKIGEGTNPPVVEVEKVDTRPRDSSYDAATDTWAIGVDDANLDIDELARYARPVMDRDGKPLGIQVVDDIPDDHVALARGAKRGDIIIAINGKPVTSMADIRRVVRADYDAGVNDFTVTYRRDGQEGTKHFKAPARKSEG